MYIFTWAKSCSISFSKQVRQNNDAHQICAFFCHPTATANTIIQTWTHLTLIPSITNYDQLTHLDIKNKQRSTITTSIAIVLIRKIINDCQQRASLYIVGIIRKRSVFMMLQTNVLTVKCMCIGIDPCTHLCACHCSAHCVSVVNQETVRSQCKSGRLLIAAWRISCVIFVFFPHFLLSFTFLHLKIK